MAIVFRVICILLVCLLVIQPANATSTATPAAGTRASAAARMLGQLPDVPLGQDGAMVTYADLALQTAILGIDAPPGADDEDQTQQWLEAIRTLAIPQATGQHWSRPEWREAFGFDLFQVDQAVEYAALPLSLTIVRGTFDPAELRDAWTRSGYAPVDLGAGEAFSVRADFEVDFADSGSRMALAHFNVAALADDGLLIFGSSRDIVARALAASAGQRPSFADRPEIQPLLRGAPAELASALLLHGEALQAVPDPAGILLGEESPEEFMARAEAERVEAQELPPIVSALIGQTAGSFSATNSGDDAEAELVAVLATTGAAPAEQGAAVIADRLETQLTSARLGERPWTELFRERSVRALTGEAAIQIELCPVPGVSPTILQEMIFQRDPGFLAWSW